MKWKNKLQVIYVIFLNLFVEWVVFEDELQDLLVESQKKSVFWTKTYER